LRVDLRFLFVWRIRFSGIGARGALVQQGEPLELGGPERHTQPSGLDHHAQLSLLQLLQVRDVDGTSQQLRDFVIFRLKAAEIVHPFGSIEIDRLRRLVNIDRQPGFVFPKSRGFPFRECGEVNRFSTSSSLAAFGSQANGTDFVERLNLECFVRPNGGRLVVGDLRLRSLRGLLCGVKGFGVRLKTLGTKSGG
jgi:hypothetical protein